MELGGTPPPLTENHSAQKPLAERGDTPPPLNGKNPLSSILQVPFKHKYEFVFRLCSFPSPNYFIKPCDMHDTIKPFCYTRLNEVFSLISNHFAGSEGGNENQYCRKAGTLVMATRIGDTVR